MNKFKKATKRITAVAASAVMVGSAVFAAGLSSYPTNFVSDNKFNGQVVVGSAAAASDSTAANSIIDDLASQFSGESEQVKITYRSSSSGGESVNVVKSNSELNYGESLSDSGITETLDDGDVDFLEDGRFDNGKSDEDYTQEINVSSGTFNYALRDNVDGVDEISNNLYFDNGDVYLTYTLEFDNAIALSGTQGTDDGDFVGETLTIMGNEFTVASVTGTSSQITQLELIGGANKVSLGEGESTSVTVDGTSYEIAIQSVSTSEVLMTVNGQSISVDEYEVEDVAGVSVAVTDLVDSDRDSIKGYAELVVGGQKVTIEDSGEVQINDEDVSDLYDGYLVESTIATGGFSTMTLTYKVDDDVSLEAGDSLIDPLFDGFSLVFEGTNDPDYETVELSVNDDEIKVTGTLENGDDFDRALLYTTASGNSAASGTDVYLKGDQDGDRIFTSNSIFAGMTMPTGTFAGTAVDISTINDSDADSFTVDGTTFEFDNNTASTGTAFTTTASLKTALSNANIEFYEEGTNLHFVRSLSSMSTSGGTIANSTVLLGINFGSTGIKGSGFTLYDDTESQYLYEISNVDTTDKEVDLDEMIEDRKLEEITVSELKTDVEKTLTNSISNTTAGFFGLVLSDLSTSRLAFANEGLLDFSSAEDADFNTPSSSLTFVLDSADTDADNEGTDDTKTVTVNLGWDTTDEELDLTLSTPGDFVNDGFADQRDGDSDVQIFVDVFGTMVEYDNDESTYVKIMVPEEQVRAQISLVTGGSAASTMTTTVDSADVDAKRAELEEDGYTIVSTESMSSSEVEFDVSAPVMDSAVSGMSDMIVVGGPAVNTVAAALLGMSYPTYGTASGVNMGESVIRYFEASNSVLVYGYSAADTTAAVAELNAGGLSGNLVNVQ